jgi:hypothetical protein
MSPPARAALLLRVESRLRVKLARAERTIGRSVDVLPVLATTSVSPLHDESHDCAGAPEWSAAELRGEIARLLARWRSDVDGEGLLHAGEHDVVAAASADASGWIALLDDGRLVALLSAHDNGIGATDRAATIRGALECAAGRARCVLDSECETALRELDAWIAGDWTLRSSGVEAVDTSLRRRVRRALEQTLEATPRHRRARLLAGAATIRRALTRPLPLGVERSLDALVNDRVGRAEWVEEACAVIARAPTVAGDATSVAPPGWRAMIVFG